MIHPAIANNLEIHKLIASMIVNKGKDDRWDAFIEASKRPERKYKAKMREVFSQQLDEIMGNMSHFKSVKALDDWLIEWSKYNILLNEFGQLELPGILTTWANQELDALELGISFNVLDPKVQTAIENRTNHFADSVVNETRDRLHEVVSESIGMGDGIPQLEKKIRQLYDNMNKYRAVRIARSETIWAQNEGAEWGYIQSGVVEAKQWWTAKDERLCPYCNSMHGEPMALDGEYQPLGSTLTVIVDGKPKTMTFNYEGISHPPLHPNCRCVLIPIVSL